MMWKVSRSQVSRSYSCSSPQANDSCNLSLSFTFPSTSFAFCCIPRCSFSFTTFLVNKERNLKSMFIEQDLAESGWRGSVWLRVKTSLRPSASVRQPQVRSDWQHFCHPGLERRKCGFSTPLRLSKYRELAKDVWPPSKWQFSKGWFSLFSVLNSRYYAIHLSSITSFECEL